MSNPSPPDAGRAAGAATDHPLGGAPRENRLAREQSPYLLQHAHNPVDWYPWGDEAFAKARAEGRPIFLSIGYSTCHWCHVMERESFENEAVAELLNRDFVAVKVDREERPDVDRVYMTAMQAMGMGGGWPLTVFLTPDLTPFYGGTYFPAESRGGHVGMMELLPRIREAWTARRADLEQTGAHVIDALAGLARVDGEAAEAEALFAECVRSLEGSFDAEHGGFGRAPKFPSTPNLAFLMRWWARDPQSRGRARAMALKQLDAMRAGGIHDHLGGGFHRYATDREWVVPHFEKMLYDQALIAEAYVDAWQATGEPAYAAAARGIFAYVARDLSSDRGGFLSAEDADSEGEEGRFYVWRPAELAAALGEDDAALFAHRYGVTPQGNFEHGTSILHEAHTLAETAARFRLEPDAAAARLEAARARLFAAREKRVRPHRDDKVIAAWNGLMIAAFARGGRVLGDAGLVTRAAAAGEFAWTTLRDAATGALRRRWRGGDVGPPFGRCPAGQLDDYAYVAHGFLALFGATHDPLWLERAAALTEAQVARFWDDADGAFFESPADDDSVRVRMKDGFDGAELAGNSVAAANLLRLASLLARPDWRALADRTLEYHRRKLKGNAWAMPQMLAAMDLASAPSRHVVIAGARGAGDTRALLAVFDRAFRPTDELVVVDDASRAALSRLAPFTASLAPVGGRATAYVCVNHACRLPATDPEAFAKQLDDPNETGEHR